MDVRWRILYDDGSVFSDTDGLPVAAPAWGVEAIWQASPHTPLYNKDYYLWREDYDCWIEVDLVGLVDHLVTAAPQITAVKVGRTVPTPTWKAAMHHLNALAAG